MVSNFEIVMLVLSFFDEINIEFGFIWELSAENLQTNPKIRWGLFWGLFKTQNRNIQLFSPVNQCNNHHQHSKYKKQKRIQQTLLPLMNSSDINLTRKYCFFLHFLWKLTYKMDEWTPCKLKWWSNMLLMAFHAILRQILNNCFCAISLREFLSNS